MPTARELDFCRRMLVQAIIARKDRVATGIVNFHPPLVHEMFSVANPLANPNERRKEAPPSLPFAQACLLTGAQDVLLATLDSKVLRPSNLTQQLRGFQSEPTIESFVKRAESKGHSFQCAIPALENAADQSGETISARVDVGNKPGAR